MDDAWRSKNENPMNRNWRRSYYERGGWKERGRRHFHGRPRWSDERYLHPRGSQEQSDRAHVSYSAEKDSLFCSYQESGQASWHRT
ncbi:hypothetical protein NECAME_17383 [Necator americanus]|uniref:Uncharacterized protein n=1 Tax=Necator americanus TaxID=51031 RepID=W2TPI6_NECAM|nr:hypothetical protein NECAME_17383 [Necator americanus]ETN83688.1 hypothetical protein NECAME_17383 [Necator americanus]